MSDTSEQDIPKPIKKRRVRLAAREIMRRVRIHTAGRPEWRGHAERALKGLGAGVGYAALVEPHWIETNHIDLTVPELHPALDGYRVLHLSDVHFNMIAGAAFLERVVEKSNALDADVVAISGDFVTHNPARFEDCLSILGGLTAPDGVVVSRGNHDYGAPLNHMRALCEKFGLRLLENEHTLLRPSRGRVSHKLWHEETPEIVFAGVGDLWEGVVDFGAALDGAPDGVPRILLSHNPQTAELLTPYHQVALQLSGHTHGGQIRLRKDRPIGFLSDGSVKYSSGMVRAPHAWVHISRGVGTSALRLRWNCRPQIALISLHPEI